MADDEPSEYAVQERGHFWWAEEIPPERYPYLPSSAVAGELKITSEGRITVQLDRPLDRPNPELSGREEYEALRASRIRGLLRNSGQGVLLFDLAQFGGGLLATRCLIGDQPFAGRIKEPAFSRIYADLKGFEEWLWTRALNVEHGRTVSRAKYRKPKQVVYRLQSGRLLLVQGLNSTSKGLFDITWSASAFLRFHPKRTMGMDATIEWHRWLQDFMILLTDSDYRLEWPNVRWGNHHCTLYFQWFAPKGQRPHIHECPTNFPKISERFGTLFEKWLEVRNTYGPGVYLYLSTRRGMQLYAESQFTLLVTGLETFHRTKYGDVSPPRATAKVDRIVSQITTARDRTWAKTQLTGAILPRLEARIFEAINALLLGFDEGRLKRFARDCAKLRNDLAHYGGDRDRAMPYTDFVSLVMKKNNALRPLCHALVLTEIGLDPAEVRAWAVESGPAFRRNWYFAEVGLIDHADPNGPSARAKTVSPTTKASESPPP